MIRARNLTIPAEADCGLYLYNTAYHCGEEHEDVVGDFRNITYTSALSERYCVVVKLRKRILVVDCLP